MAELSDIHYFNTQHDRWPEAYAFVEQVQHDSGQDPRNADEFQRRLDGLARMRDPIGNQWRQAVDFVGEMVVFEDLFVHDHEPLWVPEHPKLKMPDIEYRDGDGLLVPVEVKHLNKPRDEDDAFSVGQPFSGVIREEDLGYERFLQKKVEGFVDHSAQKLEGYTTLRTQGDQDVASSISLELLYSQSLESQLISEMPGEASMGDRLRVLADTYVADKPVIAQISALDEYLPPAPNNR
jgi:hypothetical protein